MPRSAGRSPAAARAATVLVTALAAGLVPGPAEAARTVSESYSVPSNGVLKLTGHGFGHGRGMSQYGAYGAAKQGLNHRQILAYYYPGTTLSAVGGTIRVLITADTDDDVRVLPADGLRIREVASGNSWALPGNGATTWRLRTVGGATVLDYDQGGWKTYRPGGSTLAGEAEFYRPGALTLRVAGTTRVYRGAMRLSRANTVNVLSMDDYVKGVVPREMPASWHPEAVRAQSVAARTYGAFERAVNLDRYYQICDTTSCQVYGGVGAEDSRANAAVEATSDQVVTWQGKPAFTQFSSSSGGWLSAGSMPYLVAKEDRYDNHAGNPVHSWTNTVTRAAIQKVWPGLGTLKRVVVTRREGNGRWYGRVEQMVLDGSKSNVTISGATFRSRFGLRSHWFKFGAAGSAPAPAPAPAPQEPPPAGREDSPISDRWRAIGGYSSVVGGPTSAEYGVASGQARRFQRGRIYHKAGVGAHELYGRVLKAYTRRGAATSRLGFPMTEPRKFRRGTYAKFEKGVIKVFRSGRVRVSYSR